MPDLTPTDIEWLQSHDLLPGGPQAGCEVAAVHTWTADEILAPQLSNVVNAVCRELARVRNDLRDERDRAHNLRHEVLRLQRTITWLHDWGRTKDGQHRWAAVVEHALSDTTGASS